MLKYLLIYLLLPVAMQANENRKLNAVLNYHQISERIGTGGQPTPDQFKAIEEAGFQTVINPVSYTHLTLPTTPYV